MLLSNYLKEKNLSLKDFSLITRLSIPVIYRVLKEQNIYPRSARRIFLKTAGMVDYKNIRDFPITAENYNAWTSPCLKTGDCVMSSVQRARGTKSGFYDPQYIAKKNFALEAREQFNKSPISENIFIYLSFECELPHA